MRKLLTCKLFLKSTLSVVLITTIALIIVLGTHLSIAWAAALTSVSFVPWTSDISTTGKYTINFTTVSSTPNNAKIIITFPDGFGVSGATFDSWSGIDGGRSITIAGQVVTITRDATGTASAAGAKYIVLDNITNNAVAASTYTGTVETKTSVDVNIDGPTTSTTFSITLANDGLDTSAPWPTRSHDNRNTYHASVSGPAYPTLTWSYNTNETATSAQNVLFGDGNIVYYGNTANVYALNPTGVLKWQTSNYTGARVRGMSLTNNGRLIVNFGSTINSYNISDGSLVWSYSTPVGAGDNSGINIGPDGTIYISSQNTGTEAINSDGTRKYYQTGSSGRESTPAIDNDTGIAYILNDETDSAIYPGGNKKWYSEILNGMNAFILSADGNTLFAQGRNSATAVIARNSSDGSSKWAVANSGHAYVTGSLSSDGNILYTVKDGTPDILSARNVTTGAANWNSTFSGTGWLFNILSDSNDSIYAGNSAINSDGTTRWTVSSTRTGLVTVGDNQMIVYHTLYGGILYAYRGWTLTSSSSTYSQVGGTIEITATSSMLKNDPVSVDNNIVQAVMPNGDKVLLSYSGTSGENTLWTGTYTIPADATPGVQNATIQASSYKITTDIATSFDVLPTDFNNTGITSSFTYTVDNNSPVSFSTSAPISNSITNITTPTFSWDASSDATSGLAKYQLYLDDTLLADNISSSATTYTPATGISEGTYSWHVVAVDNAGNTTSSNTSTFNIDTTAPNGAIKLDSAGTLSLNTATLNISASDPSSNSVSSGVSYMRLGETIDALNQASWESYSASKSWTFANSSRIVYIQFKDLAGNISAITNSNGVSTTLSLLKLGTINFNEKYGHYYYTGHRPTFTGIASANSKVVVTIQSDPITCTTTADGNGNWSCTPTTDIPNGDHTVTIQSVGTDGQYTLASFKLGINIGLAATGDDVTLVELVLAILLTFTAFILGVLINRSLLNNIRFGKAK
jgi:hypothetical protein